MANSIGDDKELHEEFNRIWDEDGFMSAITFMSDEHEVSMDDLFAWGWIVMVKHEVDPVKADEEVY